MVTHVYTSLDLGDLGTHEALAVGSVEWTRTGPVGSDEGHYKVTLSRVTVSVQLGTACTVPVLDVTHCLSPAARASLEEELETERIRLDEGVKL